MTQIRIFLSAVSAEFHSYRDALRRDLERPNVTLRIQENFIATGTETLDKLDDYLRQCDAMIHLVGDMTGALAQAPSLAIILERYPDLAERLPPLTPFLTPDAQALSYTQWEAWLALYHRMTLIIAVPEAGAPRDAQYELANEQRHQQQQHLERLASIERYPEIRFVSADRLAVEILRSKLHDILARAGPLKKPVILPFASIGVLFKGRDSWLDDLGRSLGPIPEIDDSSVVARVLSGLGGVGKTRLALEYAWRHTEDYTTRLFVGAGSVEALQRNLAALCRSLELEEQRETDESRQREAVLKWLRQNPGWLLILDNVDTEEVAAAVEGLVPQLFGGHLLVTSRLTNWSGSLTALPQVGILPIDAATEFLLERTDARRRQLADDHAQASILANALGCLALALEQAGAYIFLHRLTLKGYLEKWQSQRDIVLSWYDPRLMHYPKSVAVTWQTTFDQLGESARHLLQRLAWLSPALIPESLLDVPVVDSENEVDPFTALAELESYSLVTRATDSPSFSVHRLVQEITRRQCKDPEHSRLSEALQWMDAAFVGDPGDVRDWPVLNPLLPHAQAVVEHADAAGITAPAARLMNQLGLMYLMKSFYADAEPLMRRALAIDEASFGADHPTIATDLNSLAQLLKATNRLAEAEPLMRRALALDEASFGADHPTVAIRLNNLALLLKDTNRLAEAEPLMRRALAIFIESMGMEHPYSCTVRENYIVILQELGRAEYEIKAKLGNLFGLG
jgi:tetratricopeptide (TPR) repeat protein